MRRNKNGIALPSEQSPIKWKLRETEFNTEIIDAHGVIVIEDVLACDDAEFIIHAANFHERMADIVRRILNHSNRVAGRGEPIYDILDDAAALWAEMSRGEVQP